MVAKVLSGSEGAIVEYGFMRGNRSFRAGVGAEAVVQLAPGMSLLRSSRSWGSRDVMALSPRLRIYRVRGREGEDGVDVAARLASQEGVASAVPDLYIERRPAAIDVPPNDPRYRRSGT